MIRWLSHFFMVVAVVMFALAGYFYFAPTTAPESYLDIAESAKELTGCVAGQKIPVVYHFHNRSSRPMRVLGLVQC